MSKTVTFSADVYPYCLGDTVTLTDEELKRVDATAKARKVKAYEVASAVVEAATETSSDNQADVEEADTTASAEGKADASDEKPKRKATSK